MTFRDVIDKFTVTKLAEVLALDESHVRTMKTRNSIAPEHWSAIVAAAAQRGIAGVSHETLLSMRRNRFGKTDPDAPRPQAAE